MAKGKRFRVVVNQSGTTRTMYTTADGTVNAIWQLLGDLKTGDGPVTIIARPMEATAPLEDRLTQSAEAAVVGYAD